MEPAKKDVQDALGRLTGSVEQLEKRFAEPPQGQNNSKGNQNHTTIKLDGGGGMIAMAGVGFAAGACLATAVVISVWVSTVLTSLGDTNSNQDAYINATYQSVPEIRAEFDKIKAQQEKARDHRTDHHPAAEKAPE